jgi:hypothetical protein
MRRESDRICDESDYRQYECETMLQDKRAEGSEAKPHAILRPQLRKEIGTPMPSVKKCDARRQNSQSAQSLAPRNGANGRGCLRANATVPAWNAAKL